MLSRRQAQKQSKIKRTTKIRKMIKSTIKIKSRIPDSVCRGTILIARAGIPRTVPHFAFWGMPAVKYRSLTRIRRPKQRLRLAAQGMRFLLGIARQTLRVKLSEVGLHVTHSVGADESQLAHWPPACGEL